MLPLLDVFFLIILFSIFGLIIGSKIKKCTSNKLLNNYEKFIVADANDFLNYDKHKMRIEKETNTFDDEKIDIPSEKNKVDYDKDKNDKDFYIGIQYDFKPKKAIKTDDQRKKKAYVTDVDFGWEAPKQFVSCANSSISQRFKTGKKSLKPFQISCRRPNKLTAENYYRTHYKAQIIPIEDHLVRGHNYLDYSNWVQPGKIDFRILSQSTKGLPESEKSKNIPVGWNYGFHNTPAMTMP